MKSLILSFLLIFGLTALNYGRPINDIYSLKDPVVTEDPYVNDIPFDSFETVFVSVPDSNEVLLEDKADVKDVHIDTGVNTDKNLSRMKMKTLEVTPASDQSISAESMFYEKLSARLTEQYRDENRANDVPAAFDNNFCCYEFNVPRSVAVLINASGKETAKK